MESVYENSAIFLSTVASSEESSPNEDKSRNECVGKTDNTSSKRTKVLLFVLGFTLVISLVGLCTLWMIYRNKLADFDSLKKQLSAQELNSKTLRDDLMRELKELKTDYTQARKQFPLYVACNLSVNGWTACHGKLYFFISDKLNWSSSREACVSRGADLVTITSQSEQDFLVSKTTESHWIGLSDLETEGRWVWVNNQTLNETGVEFWMKREDGISEPDNWTKQHAGGEDCASLGHRDGETNFWTDAYCFEEKRFICEVAAAV